MKQSIFIIFFLFFFAQGCSTSDSKVHHIDFRIIDVARAYVVEKRPDFLEMDELVVQIEERNIEFFLVSIGGTSHHTRTEFDEDGLEIVSKPLSWQSMKVIIDTKTLKVIKVIWEQ